MHFFCIKEALFFAGLVVAAVPAVAQAETATTTTSPAHPASAAAKPATAAPPLGPVAEETHPERTPRTARNAVFVELGGAGFLYSVNYDRMIEEWFSIRIGFSYFPFLAVAKASETSSSSNTSSKTASLVIVTIMGNFFVGESNHKLELGLGPLFVFGSTDVSNKNSSKISGDGFAVGGTGNIGYRYSPKDGGSFSAAVLPQSLVREGSFRGPDSASEVSSNGKNPSARTDPLDRMTASACFM